MKRIFQCLAAFMLALLLTTNVSAQFKTPAPSPVCKMTQTVGLTDITLEYSRPSMKDREIFAKDGLVPYGEMWRTGANKNTMITVSDDIKVNGKDLKKGTYSIFTVPKAGEWDVIFYTDTENWGIPENWDVTKEAARVTVKSKELPMTVESFLINIGDLRNSTASLEFIWANTLVEVPIEVNVDQRIKSEFEKLMAGPTASDYYRMASYLQESGGDLNQALDYISKATMEDPKFWMMRRKGEILAELGKYKEAVEAAKSSLKLAQDAGNMDYVKINEKNIAEWNTKIKSGK